MRVEVSRSGTELRSGFGCMAALAVGTVVFLIISLVSAVVFIIAPQNGSVSASFIHQQPGAIPWDGRQRLDVLLIGLDAGQRAQALAIASYRPDRRAVDVLSIPSDLWVTVPGFGQARIADAYGDGGARLTLLTVESITHVPIPYYVAVDGPTFHRMIDAFGGVALPAKTHRARQLSGVGALAYLQERGPEAMSDFGQMQREQTLLLALRHRAVLAGNAFKIPTIVSALGGSIPSNFPYNQMPAVAHNVLQIPDSHIRMFSLSPGNGTVADYRGSAQVLLPDWLRIKGVAQRLLPHPELHTGRLVEVLNGSGVSGQAASLAAWLQQAGVGVTDYRSADSFSYAHTEVLVRAGSSPAALRVATDVATLLQAPLVTRSVWGQRVPVAVLIGRDFQDPTQQ